MPGYQPLDHVFLKFVPFEGTVPAGFRAEFTGALVSTSFKHSDQPNTMMARDVKTSYPVVNEDYFEYVSVLKSIDAARGSFVMVELGAGYGAWIVTAYKAIRQLKEKKDLSVFLVGVEADPVHYQMMHEHFRTNGLDPQNHRLIQAAVTDHEGGVWFTTGSPHEWWGQAVVTGPDYPGHQYPDQKNVEVRAITLESILRPLASVDLLDLDIQGEEFKALSSAPELLREKAKRLHIGTHSHEIEEKLRELLRGPEWTCEFDFPCGSTQETAYGRIDFIDGVQAWRKNRPG